MDESSDESGTVVALSGGIGGAKLVLGLSRVLPPGSVTAIANTGDDFEHLGLAISPDLDTLLYTLAGVADPIKGWGRSSETWQFMKALESLGGPTWFQLGDSDLATHIERTRRLAAGQTLTTVIDDFRCHLGIPTRIVPMSDDPVRTCIYTAQGWMDFQDYFVRLRAAPQVLGIEFMGVKEALAQPLAMRALSDPMLRAVIICPSNPLISIAPILALAGIRRALAGCHAPIIAVSPLIGGNAVKGPTAKMFTELGYTPNAATVAHCYDRLLDGYVLDTVDAHEASTLDLPVRVAPTLMVSVEDRDELARVVIDFADKLSVEKALNPLVR